MRFALEQFSEVFRIRDAAGRPYILIGGQAVNYWAERYLAAEPTLRKLLPFTSVDIDFRGNREDVQRIAEQLNATPVYPPKVAMTALAGAVPLQIGGEKSNIEIVRRVPGVSASAIEALAVEAEWLGRQIPCARPHLAAGWKTRTRADRLPSRPPGCRACPNPHLLRSWFLARVPDWSAFWRPAGQGLAWSSKSDCEIGRVVSRPKSRQAVRC